MQLLLPGALGLKLLFFPFQLLLTFLGSPFLFLLVFLSLLFIVALAFLGFLLCLGFGCGCHRGSRVRGLFCCCSWIVDGAMIVRTYGEGGSYALAVDYDRGLSGCTWCGRFCVRVLDYRINL